MSSSVKRMVGLTLALLLVSFSLVPGRPARAADVSPGDDVITIDVGDSYAGGSVLVTFEKAYAGATPEGTPVYVYVPQGVFSNTGVVGNDPQYDPNPNDAFVPCATRAVADYAITQAQVTTLGDTLANQIVAVDEAHFGQIGLADPTDPSSDALVVLAYNVLDEYTYNCAETSYTAGYFAPGFLQSYGMNVIVVDSLDWANSVGAAGEYTIEGIIAHELEHLVHEYSDKAELSWVDEGLADVAAFLNGYDVGALSTHVLYHQVFHRDTSLTRWGSELENYGAAYTYFLYLWEQAGGNGDGTYRPDLQYDARAGDLLIKLIFENQLQGMAGVQAAIDAFNAQTGANLRSAEELFKDWVIAVYRDDERSQIYDIKNIDFGTAATSGWTIELANEIFYNNRGIYKGAMPEAKWKNFKRVPAQTALPFGTSYEVFRNPGPTFSLTFDGDDTTGVDPHSGADHWYGGYKSASDTILDVNAAGSVGGATLDFWTWYFIEEGWDYGFVEALVDGAWVTVPLTDDSGTVVTTSTDPQGNNTEGNGLTGTSGGAYFVDQPEYIHVTATLPANATDVRFRYSTDPAYLDTGWFVDDVAINGAPAGLSSAEGQWVLTDGQQNNNWVVQIIASCDLTPGIANETIDAGAYIYRFEGDLIQQQGFSTRCMNGTKATFTVAISNLPTGLFTFLDAGYSFRITNTGNKK